MGDNLTSIENTQSTASSIHDHCDEWDADEIIPSLLYVGALSSAQDIDQIEKRKIKGVLTVANRLAVYDECSAHPAHLQLDITDHPVASLFRILKKGHEFIKSHHEKGEAVLVHCAAGVSRSVSMVITYLMFYGHLFALNIPPSPSATAGALAMSFETSMELVKRKRKWANPNIGFRHQMMYIEKCGGDLSLAEAQYTSEVVKQSGGGGVMGLVQGERERANEFHERINNLTERLDDLDPSSPDAIESVRHSLENLQKEVDSAMGIKEAVSVHDRAAMIILKSAAERIKGVLAEDAFNTC
jgi:protein-tyrosine phosphatase